MAHTHLEPMSSETPAFEADGSPEAERGQLLAGLDAVLDADAQAEELARTEALERMALYHARCDDAAKACWYLCRSLGLARQEPGEPNLELLFDLLGALADLPAEVATAPQPEAVGEGDGLGVFELCNQLAAARELTQEAWDDAEAQAFVNAPCPSLPAHAMH
jgi:hypothetical protein